MSRISELINYTRLAVDDIEVAIRERMIGTDGIPLTEYGNLIRSIKTSAEPLPLAVVLETKKKDKSINNFTIHDFTPIAYYIEGYEPIDLSTIAVSLELTEEDYEQEELVEEET